jgi:hypothetical protein
MVMWHKDSSALRQQPGARSASELKALTSLPVSPCRVVLVVRRYALSLSCSLSPDSSM